MKNYIKITLLLLVFALPVALSAQGKNKQLETIKFDTSIDCQNCVNTIMGNVPFIKGVKDVKCDLATKVVTIVYQPEKAKPDQLRRAIEKLGFTAKEIKAKS